MFNIPKINTVNLQSYCSVKYVAVGNVYVLANPANKVIIAIDVLAFDFN
jgi:hypothetical protein